MTEQKQICKCNVCGTISERLSKDLWFELGMLLRKEVNGFEFKR